MEKNLDLAKIRELFGEVAKTFYCYLKPTSFDVEMLPDCYKPRTQAQWEDLGVSLFKKRVMGFCGRKTEKSLAELSEILENFGVVNKAEEAKVLLEKLHGVMLNYANNSYYLTFEPTKYSDNTEGYIITRNKYWLDLGDGDYQSSL